MTGNGREEKSGSSRKSEKGQQAADVEDGTRGFPVSGVNRSTNSFSYHNQLLFSFHKVNPRIRAASRIARYSASSLELRVIYLFY